MGIPHRSSTSPTFISFSPSPRTILARYPSSIHSISTVALSFNTKWDYYAMLIYAIILSLLQQLCQLDPIEKAGTHCFNFTKYFTRRNFITFLFQPPCNITLRCMGRKKKSFRRKSQMAGQQVLATSSIVAWICVKKIIITTNNVEVQQPTTCSLRRK